MAPCAHDRPRHKSRRNEREPSTVTTPMERLAGWIWPFAVALAWLGGLLGAFGILAAARLPPVPEGGPRWDLAVLLVLSGVLGSGAALLIGRWLFAASLRRVRAAGALVVVAGIGLAVAEELALHSWATVHVGQYDSDHIGATAMLSAGLLLVTIATLGVLIAPRRAFGGAFLAQAGAAALIWVIVLANVPGLRDGIDAESWPLAILIGMAGLYAAGTLAIGLRARSHGRPADAGTTPE